MTSVLSEGPEPALPAGVGLRPGGEISPESTGLKWRNPQSWGAEVGTHRPCLPGAPGLTGHTCKVNAKMIATIYKAISFADTYFPVGTSSNHDA